MIALAAYNADPYDLDAKKVTFKEIYDRWSVGAFAEISASAVNTYTSAFAKFEKLHNTPMIDIKKAQLQGVFDENRHLSPSYQARMKTLIRGLFKYCLEYDILEKDYSQFIKLYSNEKKESIHKPYTPQEIQLLWDNIGLPIPFAYSRLDVRDITPVDTILIMIYTGMRPGELLLIENENVFIDDRYMLGGIKNDTSRNRIIPLHDDIVPLVKKRMDEGGKYLIKYKSDHPPTLGQYRTYMYDRVMEKLQMEHLPHDGRHTFATQADASGANQYLIKRIMGHKITDITQGVYTHKDAPELVEAVNKITFVKK